METRKGESRIFTTVLDKEQCAGTGMAMVLILILIGLYAESMLYFKIAIPVLLLNMTVPKIFYPLAVVWFSFANLMGLIMSNVLLSLIFIVMIIPTGLLRRLRGHDSMKIKEWKRSKSSVFKTRDKTFVPTDLIHPY